MNASGDIYGYSRERMLREYRTHVSGAEASLFLAICASTLSDEAKLALTKSAESLGYGPDGATFLLVDVPAELSPDQLSTIVEGLDPLCIVLADAQAASLFAQAYRIALPSRAAMRAFGREVRLLPQLGELMKTPAGKQRAWAALKTLPRLES